MRKIILLKLCLMSVMLMAQKPCGFYNGLQEGECKHYYSNGQLQEVAVWKKGKLEGNATLYYENGKKKEEGKYKRGFKVGVWNYYYENGQLKLRDEWVYRDHMSVAEGSIIGYYPNGNIRIKASFRDGHRVGEFLAYHENGKLYNKGIFGADGKCSKFQIFRENGVLSGEGPIDRDFNRIGRWIFYANDGVTKTEEGEMLEDKEHGEWVFYQKDGKTISKKEIYKNGERVKKDEVDKKKIKK